jgi:hypothetical protein
MEVVRKMRFGGTHEVTQSVGCTGSTSVALQGIVFPVFYLDMNLKKTERFF